MKFKSENAKGILIAFLGALLLTPVTLFMRLSEMDVWTMLFWRGFQMGAILILMTPVSYTHLTLPTSDLV